MNSKLIETIIQGTPEEKDAAARQICQSRMSAVADHLLEYLHHSDVLVRETIVIVLGVLGNKESINQLQELSKSDPEINVRIAAILAKQHAGKITYDRLKAEIKRFSQEAAGEKDEKKSTEKPVTEAEDLVKQKTPQIRRISEETYIDKKKDKLAGSLLTTFSKNILSWKVVSIAAGIMIVLIIGIYLNGRYGKDAIVKESPVTGSRAVGMMIQERIAALQKFRSTHLDPTSPSSKYPMTLEIRTLPGDTYGDLFEKVYSGFINTEIGMNTLGAFWRHINFGNDKTQNLVDLMEKETSGELLLFPNPAALNLVLNVETGSVAFQNLNKFDPDLEISIRIDNVLIR